MRIEDRILFMDGEAIILDKPAGMPVDDSRDGTLAIANHLDVLRFGFQRRPQAVHRLDRDTSGCLLLARNPKAHKRFAAAWEKGSVGKIYLAVLDGAPAAGSGVVELALAKTSTLEAGWRIVPDLKGKPSRTNWQVLRVEDGRALVLFRPETGRTHQIRVHAASGLGIPIVGDPVYGRTNEAGMLLHAARLDVPRDGKKPVAGSSPLPDRFGSFAGQTADG